MVSAPDLLPWEAALLPSAAELLESYRDLFQSDALRGGPEPRLIGHQTDDEVFSADLAASAPVPRLSNLSLLRNETALFVSPGILSELDEDLSGHSQCRITG